MPAAASAQEHQCACCANGTHGGHATAEKTASEYDLGSEGLFSGVIHSVMRHTGMDLQLTVGVGERNVEVLVAPVAWLEAKGTVFRPGERIEIVGSPSGGITGDALLARELHTAGQTVIVRDTDGRPLWN
jgi:hypothetical protein